MKLTKSITAGITGLSAAVIFSGSALAVTWDMPTPYPDKTFHTQNIIEFAKDVEARTEGKLKIKIHSAGSLFKHAEIKNAVRGGQVPIGEFILSRLSNENPIFGIDSQPFFATNYDQAKILWEIQKPYVVTLLDKEQLMPLFSVPWPPQNLYTKKEITKTEDLKGVKFRAYNATQEKLADKLGAAPTAVEVPDIPQAFATGRVEAMLTSPSTGANSKAWDFVEYYNDIQAWLPKNVVVVNKRAFRKLDKEIQETVLAAAAEAEKRGWEMSMAETAEKTAILKEHGMKMMEPTPELMDGLKTIGSEMIVEWQQEAGADGAKLVEEYNGAVAQ